MRDRVAECLQLPVGGLQVGGAVAHPLFQFGVELEDFRLRPLAFGDVAEKAHVARSPVNRDDDRVDIRMDHGAVLPETRNVRRNCLVSADLGFELGDDAWHGFLRMNVRHTHGSQFVLGISEHSAYGRVRVLERLGSNVGNQDAIGALVKQRVVSGRRLPLRLLRQR